MNMNPQRHMQNEIESENKESYAFRANQTNMFLLVVFIILLVITMLSILKLGYQLAVLVVKLGFSVIVACFEVIIIYSLLYPTKGLHQIIVVLEYILKNLLLEFLEKRRSESVVLKLLTQMMMFLKAKYCAYRAEDKEEHSISSEVPDPYRVHIY